MEQDRGNLWPQEATVTTTLTARYVETSAGCMGQILEWPEVVTEGSDIEDCRESLHDALEQIRVR